LGFLVRVNWLREKVVESSPKGGKRARRWQVSPFLCATAQTADTAETFQGRREDQVSAVSAVSATAQTSTDSPPEPDPDGYTFHLDDQINS
jgi:hypothetical protein